MISFESKKMAKAILKAEVVKRGLTFKDLSVMLPSVGNMDSYDTMRLKINRGTFSFAFFLDCMKALGATNLDLEYYFQTGTSKQNEDLV